MIAKHQHFRAAIATGALFVGAAHSQAFQDVTAGSGLTTVSTDNLEFGTGICAADFDGDGDLDLVIPQRSGERMMYFRNNGNMTFSEDSLWAGLGVSGQVRACQAADVDNDGDIDLYVGRWHDTPKLFINNGRAWFTEQAALRGLTQSCSGWGASFGDFDRDGWIDLYVGNRFETGSPGTTARNILYRNTGDGHFVDVTNAAGVAHSGGATFMGVFVDYDEDGWPDIYVCNDKGTTYAPNQLFRNNRNGTFTGIGGTLRVADRVDAMGFDFADVFNDGGLDFFVSDLAPDHLFRVWDETLGYYTNRTAQFGLEGGLIGWAAHFLDYDNDGWQDLHVVHMNGANHLYRNPALPLAAGARWSRVQNSIAPTTEQTTAICADFDNDGRVDMLHRMMDTGLGTPPVGGIQLHRNVTPVTTSSRWLKVHTIGTRSNTGGVGARVVVHANGKTQRQHVRSGVGYLSGNDSRLHFGLGNATHADIDVYWPSGQVQNLYSISANQILNVFEPEFEMLGSARTGSACFLDLQVPNDAGLHYAMMLAMDGAPGTMLPDGRMLPIVIDELTAATLGPGNGVLIGNVAPLHRGWGQALMIIPSNPDLIGIRLWAACFTYERDVAIRTILPAVSIDIE